MTRVLLKNLAENIVKIFDVQKSHSCFKVHANNNSLRSFGTSSTLSSSAFPAARTHNESKDDSKFWVKSPYPDIQTVTGVTVPEMIWPQIAQFPQATAMECGITGRKLTFGDIYSKSRGFAAALMKSGLKHGDVIGVVLPNIPEFAIVLYGAWEAGLSVSPVNPSYTADEIKRQLLSSEAKCAVTIDYFLDAVRGAKECNQNLKSIVMIGDARDGCHTFSEMTKSDTTGVEFSKGSQFDTQDHIASLLYSSGTTGPPKGVMITHFNIISNFLQYNQPDVTCSKSFLDTGEQERFIGLLPFFHCYGLAAFLVGGMYYGASTICLPKFEPPSFLKAVRDHKPTMMHLVTPLISYIVNSPDFGKKELQHIHTINGGAAPIGGSLINRLIEKAGKYIFFQEGYGMTEMSPLSHILNPSTKNQKIGSCGRPVSSTLTKIVDLKTGESLPAHQRGEICVQGPQVMKGYFKNEEATRNTIDADGWLHTGDIGYYDEDKCFYVVDRLKELIKVKGFQVSPSELEDILRKHTAVDDVAVIGIPDEASGELPRAYIVRKSDTFTEDDVNSYLEPIVASFKQLRGGIAFVKTIPKAPSGKILRRELIQEYKKENNIPI